MSRIMRTFYRHAEATFSFEVIKAALDDYKADLDSFDARIQMRLKYPAKVESLRSGLTGYQYYDIAMELLDIWRGRAQDHAFRLCLFLDLPLFAGTFRTCAPDARSAGHTAFAAVGGADIGVVDDADDCLWFEDMIELCRRAVPTETQVMVKREDEQAFAELNAANPIFVEDAARLFAAGLLAEPRVGDFRVMANHQESLHSHDAVSILTHGPTFEADSLDPRLFATLVHEGSATLPACGTSPLAPLLGGGGIAQLERGWGEAAAIWGSAEWSSR